MPVREEQFRYASVRNLVARWGAGPPGVMMVFLGLWAMLMTAGCSPWNTRRASSDRVLHSGDSALAHVASPKREATDTPPRDAPIPIVQTNATSPRIPEFQFSAHTPQLKLNAQWPTHDAPESRPEPGLLAPVPGGGSPVMNDVVRIEPQHDDSHVRLVGFDDFEGVSPLGLPAERCEADSAASEGAHDLAQTFHADEGTVCDEYGCRIPGEASCNEHLLRLMAWANRVGLQVALLGSPEPFQGHPSNEPPPNFPGILLDRGTLVLGQSRALPTQASIPGATSETPPVAAEGSGESEGAPWTEELLRLLHEQIAILDSEQASGMDSAERNYWRYQAQALINLVSASSQSATATVPRQALSETVDYLRRAIQEIESLANLTIPHAAFCTEVRGFGQYEPWCEQVAQQGQPLLIYCELRNYVSRPQEISGEQWFVTKLRSRLFVRDPLGRIVQRAEFPLVEDLARNYRQDFYLHVPFTVGDLAPGSYRLDLVIEDIEGNKTACYQPGLSFRVR